MLDLLIATDILMSVTVLMVSLYLMRPVEFTSFPTTLLLLTLFRLALNISSSRLILLNGNTGTTAAGEVIGAFGSFVVGGNYIIGAVIFLVLIAIQYVVINHGAVRISEVTARFTLDALPGKQMSIDSDLNAGLIDETEAKRRRKQLATEAEFYGAMDGASRFTQRDAVASILITGINIVAGFLIGVLQHGMEFAQGARDLHRADHRRRAGDGDSGADDFHFGRPDRHPRQLRRPAGRGVPAARSSATRSRCCWRRGCWWRWPRCPACPSSRSCCWAAAAGAVGWRMRRRERRQAGALRRRPSRRRQGEPGSPAAGGAAGHRGGAGAGGAGGRRAGFAAAAAHFGDPPATGRRTGLPAAAGAGDRQPLAAQPRVRDLAQGRGDRALRAAAGLRTGHSHRAPGDAAAGRPAHARAGLRHAARCGFPAERAERARNAGYTVVDGVSVLGTHLAELIRRYAHELFSRQDAKRLLDRVAVENPKVVEDLVPKLLPLAAVQRVLAEPAAGARFHPRRGVHSGGAGRGRRRPRAIPCC